MNSNVNKRLLTLSRLCTSSTSDKDNSTIATSTTIASAIYTKSHDNNINKINTIKTINNNNIILDLANNSTF